MKSVVFCFATHNHQPIGNFDHIIEEAYQHSYLPFFELAAKYPVRFATHFTGILLDWLETKHPERLESLASMVRSGQLEIISGGFFEPILSVIPPEDQQAQIAKLTEKIRALFHYDPIGMWLAERVWEQPLASVLHDAGIKYVLLDDTHFISAGLREEDLNGYYLTEDKGKTLAAFPISKALRYTIPFAAVDETIRVLRDAASESGTNIVCFADDGEKFGVWPRTYEHVYTDGWLEEFFRKLSENNNWIQMLHPREATQRIKPVGRIYLPNASYAEMMQWSLPTAEASERYEDFVHELNADKQRWERYLPFVRGGYWRNFFAKYPEINHLHKHSLRTSARLLAAEAAGLLIGEARNELLASQCNDPYWHGVFGGAYLTNLRHANYTSLVRADHLLDEAEGLSGIRFEAVDMDCDGSDEIILETKSLSVYVKPSLGGMIAEIDFKPRSFNVMNIISRREEPYHKKITQAAQNTERGESKSIHDIVETKEAGLEKLIVYDWYRHGCAIEHILDADVTIEDLRAMRFHERGNFVTSAFDWSWNTTDDRSSLTLSCLGSVYQDSQSIPLRLTKNLEIGEETGELRMAYTLTNESERPLRLKFASEWVFHLLAGAAHDRYYESNGKKLDEPNMNSAGFLTFAENSGSTSCNLRLVDGFLQMSIELRAEGASASPTMLARFPIESVSLSEAGFERGFQGSIVMPIWDLELGPGSEWSGGITINLSEP
ncbi:MAG TPA: alpha-amylase/4-alpha-glucanotransferase domain-containing protein [Candidatus Kapabacteria bacterium]|jgi:alpha-amylase|nr:alpha-amylase/4-alpha-glucanotransferase domain-containing protein [Candidatus Kapabacteria bacterium]